MIQDNQEAIDTRLWGQLESASSSSEDEPEDEVASEGQKSDQEEGDGTETPANTTGCVPHCILPAYPTVLRRQ